MSSVHLFTGENSFALRQEKLRWIRGFKKKHGDENLIRLSAQEITYAALLDEAGSAPFIAESRLVVVDGIPSLEKGQMETLPQQMHPSVVLLFVSEKPDKRLNATKELLAIAEHRDFPVLKGYKLRNWMRTYMQERGTELTSEAEELLLSIVGEDQEMLAQELTKLAVYAAGKPVQADDAQQLAACVGEQRVFYLIDLIAAGKPQEAVLFSRKLLERGESPTGLWHIILWIVHQLVLVGNGVREGTTHPGALVKKTGAKIGAAKGLLPLARTIGEDALRRLAADFAQADRDVKTGSIRMSAQAPEEMTALVETSLYTLATTAQSS